MKNNDAKNALIKRNLLKRINQSKQLKLILGNVKVKHRFLDRHCLYEERCLCNDESFFIKSLKSSDVGEGRRFAYPDQKERCWKSFQINYEKPLTTKAKLVLDNFKNKYIFYAIDDIMTILYSNRYEQENLLTILYSSMLWLHNNLYINFFDIWIDEIYIHEKTKNNRFLKNDNKNLQPLTQITLVLFYKTRLPFKKPDPLW